jgi:hypothetical protein
MGTRQDVIESVRDLRLSSTGEIARALGKPERTVSYHVRQLRADGVFTGTQRRLRFLGHAPPAVETEQPPPAPRRPGLETSARPKQESRRRWAKPQATSRPQVMPKPSESRPALTIVPRVETTAAALATRAADAQLANEPRPEPAPRRSDGVIGTILRMSGYTEDDGKPLDVRETAIVAAIGRASSRGEPAALDIGSRIAQAPPPSPPPPLVTGHDPRNAVPWFDETGRPHFAARR